MILPVWGFQFRSGNFAESSDATKGERKEDKQMKEIGELGAIRFSGT